jgi:MFS superfamily sulfate permease-like transporter
MSLDPATLVVGIAGGAAAGLAVSYVVFYRRGSRTKVQVIQRDESGQMRRKTVTVEELDGSKREMRTLMLERDLLSAALTKVYEAESDGQITREERELIARKYSSQIRDFESKLRDKELIVEVGELERLRDELVSLFREKIQNIESRLDQAKERLQPVREEARPEPQRPSRPITSASISQTEDLERVVERKAPIRKDDTEGEKRVKALRDEVMDALAELEQIDTRKETETA